MKMLNKRKIRNSAGLDETASEFLKKGGEIVMNWMELFMCT